MMPAGYRRGDAIWVRRRETMALLPGEQQEPKQLAGRNARGCAAGCADRLPDDKPID